jgi:hypothetical protein
MLRINGQDITTGQPTPVEGLRPAGGALTQKPVSPSSAAQLQEQMFDAAHMAQIAGENALAMIEGRRKPQKREIKKNGRGVAAERPEHRVVEGVFAEGDPSNRQERAFQTAAEFEEEVKSNDLSFRRKAGQVEVSSQVYQVDLDGGNGALVMGESTIEIDVRGLVDADEREITQKVGRASMSIQPPPMPSEDTIPNVQVTTSETGLRRILGLSKK